MYVIMYVGLDAIDRKGKKYGFSKSESIGKKNIKNENIFGSELKKLTLVYYYILPLAHQPALWQKIGFGSVQCAHALPEQKGVSIEYLNTQLEDMHG